MNSVSERNKLKVRLFIEAVLNDGRLELIDELVAADYVGRVPWTRQRVLGPEGVRRLILTRHSICPDLYVKIEDQIAEEDRVATRWQATQAIGDRATTPGDAGTRRYPGISIVRLLAGKQVDSYTECTDLAPRRPVET